MDYRQHVATPQFEIITDGGPFTRVHGYAYQERDARLFASAEAMALTLETVRDTLNDKTPLKIDMLVALIDEMLKRAGKE